MWEARHSLKTIGYLLFVYIDFIKTDRNLSSYSQSLYFYNKRNLYRSYGILSLTINRLHMRVYGGTCRSVNLFSAGDFPSWEVLLMAFESVLALMISFGMLIAFIMSDKGNKK
jgi:ABC-type polysaccharide/polyol phosphate export permease